MSFKHFLRAFSIYFYYQVSFAQPRKEESFLNTLLYSRNTRFFSIIFAGASNTSVHAWSQYSSSTHVHARCTMHRRTVIQTSPSLPLTLAGSSLLRSSSTMFACSSARWQPDLEGTWVSCAERTRDGEKLNYECC